MMKKKALSLLMTLALVLSLATVLGVGAQAATLGDGLYTQVEYIESPGAGYIDTGWATGDASSSYAYEVTYAVPDATPGTESSILGTYNPDANGGDGGERTANITLLTGGTTKVSIGDRGAKSASSPSWTTTTDKITVKTEIDLSAKTYSIGVTDASGAAVSVSNASGSYIGDPENEENLYLFGYNSGGYITNRCAAQLYALKIWQDGEADSNLVRDFVPCYSNSDGVAGLYDRVTGDFFPCPYTQSLLYPGQEAPMVIGDAGVVVNVDTGEVYYGQEMFARHGMASTAKVMTCILTIENMDLDEYTLVATDFDKQTGSLMHLQKGEQLLIEDALYGLMLPSGNDVACLLARTVGEKLGGNYDTFIEMMNNKAQELGMLDTLYDNPVGGRYTTAYDYAKLGAYCMQNETFRKVAGTLNYTIKAENGIGEVKYDHVLRNTNYLLPSPTPDAADETYADKFSGTLVMVELEDGTKLTSTFGDTFEGYEGMTGIKTGTTTDAGACLLATATRTINGEEVNLVSMVLGCSGNGANANGVITDRFSETVKLMDYGFKMAEEQGYTVTAEGDTLTAVSPDGYTMTAKIAASDAAYLGTPVETATVSTTYSEGTWNPYWEITYANNDAVGTATASITFGGKTASVDFDIVEPTVTLTEHTTVDTLVIPSGQTYDLNGNALTVNTGLVVNKGGSVQNGTLTVKDGAVVSLGDNGGWVPVYGAADDTYTHYELYPAEIKAGKTVVSTNDGTQYSFGYKLSNRGETLDPYTDSVTASGNGMIKYGVELQLGGAAADYSYTHESIAKMAGIDASAASDAFFKINLNLTGTNRSLQGVRVAPMVKVPALGFKYVGEDTGETDGEYVARIGNEKYVTLEDAIAAAAATGEYTDVKLVGDINFVRPVTIEVNGMTRLRTAAGADITISGDVTFDGQDIEGETVLFRSNSRTKVGKLTLDGVTIKNYHNANPNSDNSYGGVIASSGATIVLNDVTIENCSGAKRGAIYIFNSGSLDATGCTFTGNVAKGQYGGVLYSYLAKDVSFEDCTFTGNSSAASYGGAIAVRQLTSMTVNNCIFTDNTAKTSGGAIRYAGDGTLQISNVTMSGNKVGSAANDIHVEEGSFNLSGEVAMSGISLATGSSVVLDDALTVAEPIAIDGTVGTTVLTGRKVGEYYTGFKGVTDDLYVTKEGILKSSYVAQVGETKYRSMYDAFEATKNAASATTIQLIGDEHFETATTLTLGQNVSVVVSGTDVTISGLVTIDGQGLMHENVTDSAGEKIHTISVQDRGSLTLKDGVTVKGVVSQTATSGAIRVYVGDLTLDGVTIENCTGVRGAVYMAGTTTLTVTDSTFKNNTATGSGGALYLWGAVNPTVITGSTFTGNTAATSGGAVYLTNGATLNVADSSFSGNKVGSVSNDVYVNKGAFNISGTMAAEAIGLAEGKAVTLNDTLTVADGTTIGIDGTTGTFVLDGEKVADYYGKFSSVNAGETVGSDGMLTAEGEDVIVAIVNGTEYTHLADAIAATVDANSATVIELVGSETFTTPVTLKLNQYTSINVPENGVAALNGPVTIDGEGKVHDVVPLDVLSGASLTLKNGVEIKGLIAADSLTLTGAIRVYGSLTMNKVTVSECKGIRGALYTVNAAEMDISNSTFYKNVSTNTASNYNGGGAIFAYGSATKVTVKNSTFDGNVATGNGSTIYNYGSSMTLDNCVIKNGDGGRNGTVFVRTGTVTLQNGTTVTGNEAVNRTGIGVYQYNTGKVVLNGVTVKGNVKNSTTEDLTISDVYFGGSGSLTVKGSNNAIGSIHLYESSNLVTVSGTVTGSVQVRAVSAGRQLLAGSGEDIAASAPAFVIVDANGGSTTLAVNSSGAVYDTAQ